MKEEKNQGNLSSLLKLRDYMSANRIRYLSGKIFMFRVMFLKNWLHLKNWQITSGGRGTLRQNHFLKGWIHHLWEEVKHNPKLLLEKIDYKRLLVLEDDDDFVADLKNVYEIFKAYMNRPDDPDNTFSCLFQYGVWNPSLPENLFRRTGNSCRRLS